MISKQIRSDKTKKMVSMKDAEICTDNMYPGDMEHLSPMSQRNTSETDRDSLDSDEEIDHDAMMNILESLK